MSYRLETFAQFFRRAFLDFFTLRQQIEHVRCLRDVAEVGRQDRIERLRNQSLHIAEPLHDRRRLLVVDMQD